MAAELQNEYEQSELYRVRHSTAHVMAQAVLALFPEAKFAIGPAIQDGFYYDFDLPRPLTSDDLDLIEDKMKEIIKGRHVFTREVISAEQARHVFKNQPYKLELIDGLEQGGMDEDGNPIQEKPEISLYKSDTFVDLCRGPHVENMGKINPKAVKLMSVAGAYWRGDENRQMLQRIYGTAWLDPKDLKDYIWKLEEAKKRDHRRLGKDLDLYSVNDEVGAGLVLWHPKLGLMRKLAEHFCDEEHLKAGYDFVYSPHIGKASLWETSGHLGFYKENMYSPISVEGQDYFIKPMNCPFHVHIYKSGLKSYKDLPLRYAENGTVYRYERSGVLHGMMRVRGFTQDDAHHFCLPEQMPDEIDFVLDFSLHILRSFGFKEFKAYLSTKPEKSVGEPERWRDAEAALEEALKRAELPYEVDAGGGAFYGPKIDLKIKDAIGREWQLSTIQFDFNLPERFGLTYVGDDGQPHRPYMIHRALLGSLERFFGILIEHYAGAFPVWLSPTQATIIPIADRHNDYAHTIAKELQQYGLRISVDDRADRMNAKIRDAQKQKIPYMLIVGDAEMENHQVSLRLRSGDNPGAMALEAFREMALEAIANHTA
ncbi:MAG: threonine--tRNA ligase [Anaerolineae bacterium]|nr:threonine--tRNA ligase [Anaerolineae bacterium]